MRVGGESRVRNQQSLSADHWSWKKMIRGEVGGMGTSTGTPDGVGKGDSYQTIEKTNKAAL